jgi:glycosyltransferase involved in cell wall biosynthesis
VVIVTLSGNLNAPGGVRLRTLHRPLGFVGDRIAFLTLPVNFYITIGIFRELSELDVLVAHFYPMTWLAEFTRRLRRKRYILYNHGILDPSLAGRSSIEKGYLSTTSALYASTLGNPNETISISDYARRQLKETTGRDSKVIYNPVDPELFNTRADSSRIRARYGVGLSPVILYVGLIERRKGIHLLVRIHQLVKKKHPNAVLLLVGRARYEEYLNQIRGEIDESVKIAGWVPNDELGLYFSACDVYATASLWEGFNLPLAEAQACGKPVVAFDVGAHREIVEDGETGFLVRPGDVDGFASKVTALLSNEGMRHEMGSRGRMTVQQKFDFQRFSSETKSLIRKLF